MRAIFFLFLATYLFGESALVSPKDIKYKEYLNFDELQDINSDKRTYCTKFDKLKLLEDEYIAKRHIIKNTPICTKDVEVAPNYKIKFDFGNIVIERSGEFIGETDKYIKVKTQDGTIEKIDKNGM
ncbi:MAG: hypothetical protein PHF17_03320 [Arcobacteraceae bacterium]|jgi:hypothetical protein|nr:hypothetical protein [Arcobacteraceae bacterium]